MTLGSGNTNVVHREREHMSLSQQKVYEVDVKFKDADGKEKTDTLRVAASTPEEVSTKTLEWVKEQQDKAEAELEDDFEADTDHEITATRFVDMVVV